MVTFHPEIPYAESAAPRSRAGARAGFAQRAIWASGNAVAPRLLYPALHWNWRVKVLKKRDFSEPIFVNLLLTLKCFKTVLKNLSIPPSGPLLLAFAGLLLQRRSPRLGRTHILAGVASLWLLATPVVADWLSALTEHYPPLNLALPTQAQAIVVLGGGGQRDFAPEYGGAEAEPYLLGAPHLRRLCRAENPPSHSGDRFPG